MTTDRSSDRARGVSRDEMNLAEFPLTVLSTRAAPGVKTLEFSDSVRGKSGETVNRHWIITGADKFGLPTSSDDEVLLGLLKLTVEDGMRDRKVYFTRYELLRTLKWSTEGRSYGRLQKALDRLSGVRIKATNAFYDNDLKAHSTRNFGIIDAYEINSSRDLDLKTSFFTWSEVLFKSFQVGFIKKLDLDFYLELQSAVSKRLYRYLDKHFWYKSRVTANLFTLCHEKIGISRNYQYASSLRQQLDPAIAELTERGFLGGHEFGGKGKDTEITLIAARGARAVKVPQPEQAAPPSLPHATEDGAAARIVHLLIERGLSERQVLKLVAGRSEELLARMEEIVRYYDTLRNEGSRLVSKSPVGFLYRAMENPVAFVLPGKDRPTQPPLPFGAAQGKPSVRKPRSQPDRTESEYLAERRRTIEELKASCDERILHGIRNDVTGALAKLRGLISPQRFAEAVDHGVDEKLAKHFGLPDFESWVISRG